MMRIKKGDEVVVIAGKSKGQRGKVLAVLNKVSRVLVEGANVITKHVKANPRAQQEGGILKRESPIHISNVMVYNPAKGSGDRVGFKTLEDGRKVRYFKSNQEVIDEGK